MSVQRPDPAADADAVRRATQELIDAVSALPAESVGEPSLLPGWTRGHVLTHLARNADAMVNLLTWARTGVETPMYADEETRNKDIEEGAGRPLTEHLDDLRTSARRLADAIGAMSATDWAAQVRTRQNVVKPAAELPDRRVAELRLHLVDLGIGYTCRDLPADFAARELATRVDNLVGREGIPAIEVHDAESGERWEIGAAEEPELTVTGPTRALLAWVTGRAGAEELTTTPAHKSLPALPPLG
ncbi:MULTISPECIES: maleylpyruvate isomerase family mycothiol-dependent enzyme [Streptomycetaceae]|uniref:Mycothiol-dependent maleylpyruvate isomerase n=1 Tax=Streptantibioticus cattleyicolor (strain ATCC 35852 / DSM 46488 / JCM 4925 / NBRC 14057 / NRRL 8057) TaxID=1003195 RepID=F8JZ02_STREN|nr:maleylpyruvate isomerase family mycothiol-dependent enzyme [Streptantibioticus cattleyicolor]AEW93479.1 mycothiol-dependent maleylpyruvate isomerase [Streptantibioticus cattleyicolor NRRL 8057 = DSM 46488]MYS58189.1 maleylpyruvate isomerase family mycothiol-dependent enzyme [Streptomyces sp. SID5468]CCB73832.1 conserved protein of unknown function [Streptantibioticus cattleyicolor NRRL 8057 = DSM 46488]